MFTQLLENVSTLQKKSGHSEMYKHFKNVRAFKDAYVQVLKNAIQCKKMFDVYFKNHELKKILNV